MSQPFELEKLIHEMSTCKFLIEGKVVFIINNTCDSKYSKSICYSILFKGNKDYSDWLALLNSPTPEKLSN